MPRRCAAEFVGTFVLVFAGTGAIVFDSANPGKIGHSGIALTFGLVVMAMAYAVGSVSGAHLNPAVTLGLWRAGWAAGRDVPRYIIAQIAGALVASGLLCTMFPDHPTLGSTNPYGPSWHTFILEAWLTAVLVFVILGVSVAKPEVRPLGGIIVGGVVALEALFAGPISGASMNPARSLAPALVSGTLDHLWLYLVAPVLGAFLAVPVCVCVQPSGCCAAKGVC